MHATKFYILTFYISLDLEPQNKIYVLFPSIFTLYLHIIRKFLLCIKILIKSINMNQKINK